MNNEKETNELEKFINGNSHEEKTNLQNESRMTNGKGESSKTGHEKLLKSNSKQKQKSIQDEPTIPAFEKLLEEVGSDGLFQRRLIWFFMSPLSYFYGMAAVHLVFIVSTPEHTCYVPGREHFGNITLQEWHNLTVPWEKSPDGSMRASQCKMYNYTIQPSFEENTTLEILDPSSFTFDYTAEVDCLYGWEYSKSVWKETASSHFNWVCDQKSIVTQLMTLKLIAASIGTFVFAILSDKYGRLPMFYLSLFLCTVFGPAMALASSLTMFAIFLFLFSLSFYTLYQMPFLLVMEVSCESLRNLTVITSFMGFMFGICSVPLLVWLIADWRIIVAALNLPMAIFFLYWRFIPESPRWLLSQDKIREFKKIMNKIASTNGRTVSDDFEGFIVLAQEEEKKKVPFTVILKSYVLAKHLILTSLLLSLGYMFYVGSDFNLLNMTGNMFINYFILSVFELPGNIVGSWASNYLGRRLSSVVCELLSAATIIITTFFIENKWVVVVCCATSKMFVGGMILAVYKQIGELFPTSLRATAYGITGIVGIALTVVVPSFMAYGSVNAAIPYYFMCCFSLLGALLSTFLPETIGLPYPQTMREAMAIGKNQSYCSIIYKGNAHKLLQPQISEKSTKTKKTMA